MKKKIISLCLVAVLLLTAIGGATLAYFTDKDQVNNTFSIGNIDIDLYEKTDIDGDGELDEREFQEYLDYSDIMPGDKLPKQAHIKNVSTTNAAYVRVAVLVNNYTKINDAIDNTYEEAGKTAEEIQAIYNNVFDGWGIDYTKNPIRGSMALRAEEINVNNNGATLLGIDYVRGVSNQYQSGSNGTSYMEGFGYGTVSNQYYKDAYLDDGRLYVFYLKLEAGADYTLFEGLNVPTDFTGEQLKMFDGLKIDIYADAIQTENFENAKAAFTALEEANPIGWWKTNT